MPIDGKKILTISADDYFRICKSNLDYEAVGIHLCEEIRYGDEFNLVKEFAKLVPEEAEVVVGYEFSVGGGLGQYGRRYKVCASGTALIHKKIDL